MIIIIIVVPISGICVLRSHFTHYSTYYVPCGRKRDREGCVRVCGSCMCMCSCMSTVSHVGWNFLHTRRTLTHWHKKVDTLLSFSIPPPHPLIFLGGGDHFFVLVFLFSRTILFLVFPILFSRAIRRKCPTGIVLSLSLSLSVSWSLSLLSCILWHPFEVDQRLDITMTERRL